jgi:hypothetical protein
VIGPIGETEHAEHRFGLVEADPAPRRDVHHLIDRGQMPEQVVHRTLVDMS